MGRPVADTLFVSLRARNERAKQRLGWAPQFPTIREGYARVLEELRA